jgi:transcriptional regulator with XRE-family HTH domain
MRSLRVKQVAQAKGFTMAKLQREADINLKTIQAIWHNPRHNASLDTLDKIAAVLRVPVTDLIEDLPADAFSEEERKAVAGRGQVLPVNGNGQVQQPAVVTMSPSLVGDRKRVAEELLGGDFKRIAEDTSSNAFLS